MKRLLVTVLMGCLTLLPGVAAARSQLAYEAGHATPHVWLSDARGRHTIRLGPGSEPLLAPGGSVVAASLFAAKGHALAIYHPGAVARQYFDVGKVTAFAEAWSPDSRFLAVALTSVKPLGTRSGLVVIDTKTGAVRTVATGSICGASFAPRNPDRLIYGRAPGVFACFNGHVDIFGIRPDGSHRRRLTGDGVSLNPVWGPRSIAFDRATPRKHDAPIYQVWLMRPDGSHQRQITHLPVPSLVEGLVPLEFSSGGRRLLAAYEGQDTSQTWTIRLPSGHARQVTIHGRALTPAGISRDGRSLLVDVGGFENPPSAGKIEAVAFDGARPRVLVAHGSEPSWNR